MYTSTDHKDPIDIELIKLMIDREKLDIYIHFYQQFGWVIENHYPQDKQSKLIQLTMKRDCHYAKNEQLNVLQYEGEQLIQNIENLENSKHIRPLSLSISLGLVGVILIVWSIRFFIQENRVLFIVFGLLGLIGCIFPLIGYEHILKKQIKKAKPVIELKNEHLLNIYRQARKLRN